MFRLVLVRKPVAYFFCDPLQTKILQRHAAGIDRAELDDVAQATDQHIVAAFAEHNVTFGASLPDVLSPCAEERRQFICWLRGLRISNPIAPDWARLPGSGRWLVDCLVGESSTGDVLSLCSSGSVKSTEIFTQFSAIFRVFQACSRLGSVTST